MPKMLRRYLPSLTVGFGLSAVLVVALVFLELGGLQGFGRQSVLYFAALGLVFSLVQHLFRRYLLDHTDEDGPEDHGPRGGLRDPRLIPVRVPALSRKSATAPRRRPRG